MAKACSEFETTPISEDQAENEISEHAEAIDFLKKTMESVNKNLDQQAAEKKAEKPVVAESTEKHTFAQSK